MEAEKFWLPVHAGLHNHDDVYLGGGSHVGVNISMIDVTGLTSIQRQSGSHG